MANRLLSLLLLSWLLLSPARAHLLDLPPFSSLLPPPAEVSLRTPPSPAGASDAQAHFLRGPVKTLLVETAPPHRGDDARRAEFAWTFDTRGYAIRAVSYTRMFGGPDQIDRELLLTNTYNAAGQRVRLQLIAYAGTRLVNLADTTFRYDAAGRLRETRTTLPKSLGSRARQTFVTTGAYDAAGRLVAEVHANPAEKGKLTWQYKHLAAGMESVHRAGTAKAEAVRAQVAHAPHGKPLRWKGYNESRGYIEYAFTYNDRGEIDRLVSHVAGAGWPPPLYLPRVEQFGDYVYDAHGNWTARTRYTVLRGDGLLEALLPIERQYRTITYHEFAAR